MLRVRSRISLSQPVESRLVVRSNLGRRVLFGIIGVVLLVSFFVGSAGGGEPMIGGTIFYFVITLISVAVAGWNSQVTFDRDAGDAVFSKSIFGIRLREDSVALASVTTVILQSLQFLKQSEQPQPTMLNSRFRGYMSRRNTYYRLFLETADEKLLIEDSSELEDLDRSANLIAAFLNVTYRREEI
jgi:hypothetical protein